MIVELAIPDSDRDRIRPQKREPFGPVPSVDLNVILGIHQIPLLENETSAVWLWSE